MTQFDKLKAEIDKMDVDKFMNTFISGRGMRDYICGDIKHPYAHCTKTDDYSCLACLREFLRGEVK